MKNEPMRPRITKQTLEVLTVLLKHPTRDHYGLEISRKAGYPHGTIYPILARLEHAGWLESDWETVPPTDKGRPARRYYRLTSSGVQRARRAVSETRIALAQQQQETAEPELPRRHRPGEAPA